jgi:hypothetical protein
VEVEKKGKTKKIDLNKFHDCGSKTIHKSNDIKTREGDRGRGGGGKVQKIDT